MKRVEFLTLLMVVTSIVLLGVSAWVYYQVSDYSRSVYGFDVENVMESAERLEMYNKSLTDSVRVNGVYFPSRKYYCVWTKDREEENIKRTECHEVLHSFIDTPEGFGHFCEKRCQNLLVKDKLLGVK